MIFCPWYISHGLQQWCWHKSWAAPTAVWQSQNTSSHTKYSCSICYSPGMRCSSCFHASVVGETLLLTLAIKYTDHNCFSVTAAPFLCCFTQCHCNSPSIFYCLISLLEPPSVWKNFGQKHSLLKSTCALLASVSPCSQEGAGHSCNFVFWWPAIYQKLSRVYRLLQLHFFPSTAILDTLQWELWWQSCLTFTKHDIQACLFCKLHNLIDVFIVWKFKPLKNIALPITIAVLQSDVRFSCTASFAESFLILLFNQSHSDFPGSFFAVQFWISLRSDLCEPRDTEHHAALIFPLPSKGEPLQHNVSYW